MQFELTNELSRFFLFRNAAVIIDGRVTFSHVDEPDVPDRWPQQTLTPFHPGTLDAQDHFIAYAGPVSSGEHTIQIALGYRGNGGIARFWFSIKSSHKVIIGPGRSLHLTAIAYEKGGIRTPLIQRPTVEWEESNEPVDAGADAN